VVLDMDSTEIQVYGKLDHSAYNGHFESTCYHRLQLFNGEGDWLAAARWKTVRQVLAKVGFHAGELFPRVGIIVTNLGTPSRR
jgi:hypothetical protein